jgi:hypothetical protein
MRNYDFLERFFGTLAPFFRASESPIAIACFLLLTFRRPSAGVPALRLHGAADLRRAFEYLRFFAFLAIASILVFTSIQIELGVCKGSFLR